jgi:hypothetical protein
VADVFLAVLCGGWLVMGGSGREWGVRTPQRKCRRKTTRCCVVSGAPRVWISPNGVDVPAASSTGRAARVARSAGVGRSVDGGRSEGVEGPQPQSSSCSAFFSGAAAAGAFSAAGVSAGVSVEGLAGAGSLALGASAVAGWALCGVSADMAVWVLGDWGIGGKGAIAMGNLCRLGNAFRRRGLETRADVPSN